MGAGPDVALRTTDGDPGGSAGRRRSLLLAALLVLVLVAALGAGGLMRARHLTVEARADAVAALGALDDARSTYEEGLSRAKDVSANASGEVADEATVKALDRAINTQTPSSTQGRDLEDPARLDRSDLETAARHARADAKDYEDLAAELSARTQAVEDSIHEESLTDARSFLNSTIGLAELSIEAAQELLDSQAGATAPTQARADLEASRATLIATVAEARTLLTGDDIDAMQAMITRLSGGSADLYFEIEAIDPAS